MSLTEIRTYGGGTIRFRLSVEGWPYEWVTHDDMQTTVDGRQRLCGLQLDGLKLSAKADLPRGTLDASGIQVKIVDVNGYATLSLGQRPTRRTWLASNCAAGATTMTVKSTAGWPSTGYLYCDTETIYYGSVGSSTQFATLTRGKWNSLDQAHYTPNGAMLRYPEVTDFPTIMEGRRARLYVYTAGESATGDGTQVWLGIVAAEPRMSGPEWSFSIDPISSVLKQEIGGDLGDPVTPRGIYYPYRAQMFTMARSAGAAGKATPGAGGFGGTEVTIGPGFWETQEAWLSDLNAALTTETSGWNCTIQARPAPDGTWYLEIVQGSGNPDNLSINYWGPRFEARIRSNWFSTTPVVGAAPVTVFAASTTYYIMPTDPLMDGAGLVPRGQFNAYDYGFTYGEDDATYSARKIYIGGTTAVSARTSSVLVEWDGEEARPYTVDTTDAGERSITLIRRSIRDSYGYEDVHMYTPSNLPKIRFGRSYNSGSTVNGVAQFLNSLMDNAPDGVNTGEQPMIQNTDWNELAWIEIVTNAPTSLCKSRSYESFATVTLEDIVAAELQMLGAHLALDAGGELTVKRIRASSATERSVFTITSANLLTSDGFPSYEKGAVGRFNTVALYTGYDPVEDEYTGPTYTVRDVSAFGLSPAARTIHIKPKSLYMLGPVQPEEAVRIAQGILGIFGAPYAYVSCNVPLTAWGTMLLGSSVTITTDHLPDADGTRGVTGLTGIVVGMEIMPYEARIALTLLVNPNRIVGYAASAKITAVTSGGAGGTTHTVTLSSDYFSSGDSAANHFEANDYIRVYKYDSTTASAQSGQVTSATGNSVTFTTSAGWTAGANTWVLAFDRADQDSSANQKLYAYVASSTGIVGWDPGTDADADMFTA